MAGGFSTQKGALFGFGLDTTATETWIRIFESSEFHELLKNRQEKQIKNIKI